MYAGTKVNWHEVLTDNTDTSSNLTTIPLFLCAFSSDKGTENITTYNYSDFKKMYGSTPDFFKYGQPLLQAHAIGNAGGKIMGKRIVAEDATLGNLIITASVEGVSANKIDKNGNLIYLDANGAETLENTGVNAETYKTVITYKLESAPNVKTEAQVEEYAKTLRYVNIDSKIFKFPIFTICENGRGTSIKNVKITPNYETSRKLTYMIYAMSDIENSYTIEKYNFTVDPDIIVTESGKTKSMKLESGDMFQFKSQVFYYGFDNGVPYSEEITKDDMCFMNAIAMLSGKTVDELYGYDVIFAKTLKGGNIADFQIEISSDSINLNSDLGLEIKNGGNGSLGNKPFPGETATTAWDDLATTFFNGSFSDDIYDLDRYKIDLCVDANYPTNTKNAIAELAKFREDFYYMRDFGLTANSVSDVETIVGVQDYVRSPFIGDYCSYYSLYDSISRKQIRVTMLYGIAPLLINHFATRLSSPLAGEYNGFSITNFVDGTLNIVPKVTPSSDQKQRLDDIHVNYINYGTDNNLVVQSTYTSQDHVGPLSYANNVLITQKVIKAIRSYCPKIRFMLMTGTSTDFGSYKALINDNVVSKYSSYFASISLDYTADEDMANAKTFNASLYCYYNGFVQGEVFDVFAIEGEVPET